MKASVLIVGSYPNDIELLLHQCNDKFKVLTAKAVDEAVTKVKTFCPDIVLLKNTSQTADCFEAFERFKYYDIANDIPVILIIDKIEAENTKKIVNTRADDFIIMPCSGVVLLQRIKCCLKLLRTINSFNMVAEKTRQEMSTLEDVTIITMASLAETRDTATGEHIKRTRLYVKELANYLRHNYKYKDVLTKQNIKMIVKASPLHDIGKIGIPDSILLKPAILTHDEFEVMKTHTTLGLNAINTVEAILGKENTVIHFAKEIIYSHHERWDGNGYPQGLKADEIPVSARLMSIADVYDALISKRVYKEPLSHEKAVEIIAAGANEHFDPEITKAFLSLQGCFKEISNSIADAQNLH